MSDAPVNPGSSDSGPKSFQLSESLHTYLLEHGSRPDTLQAELIEETGTLGWVQRMQIAPEQGALMQLLTELMGAKRAIEVGTFTGYSALCVARGLGPEGRLLCCDISEEWTAIARKYWAKAGVEDRIDLQIAPAIDTLRSLSDDSSYDLAFIDADKTGYRDYCEELIRLIRPGGLILVDNVLWHGAVIDPERQDADTVAIRAFNDWAVGDERVDCVMLPISDGLTFLRVR
jgi:caffeoyl-CoA O-methyltransferase